MNILGGIINTGANLFNTFNTYIFGSDVYRNMLSEYENRYKRLKDEKQGRRISLISYVNNLKELRNELLDTSSSVEDYNLRSLYGKLLDDIDEEIRYNMPTLPQPIPTPSSKGKERDTSVTTTTSQIFPSSSTSTSITTQTTRVTPTSPEEEEEYNKFRNIINTQSKKIVTEQGFIVRDYPVDEEEQSYIHKYLARYLYTIIMNNIENGGVKLPIPINLRLRYKRLNAKGEEEYIYTKSNEPSVNFLINSMRNITISNIEEDYNVQDTMIIEESQLSEDIIRNKIREIIDFYTQRYGVEGFPDIIGFSLSYPAGGITDQEYLHQLRAYKLCANSQFVRKGVCSVTLSNICTYETLTIARLCKRKEEAKDWCNGKIREENLKKLLIKERPELQEAVKHGEVQNVIQLYIEAYNMSCFRLFIDESNIVYIFRPHKLPEIKKRPEIKPYKTPKDSPNGSMIDALVSKTYEHMIPYQWPGLASDVAKKTIAKKLSGPLLLHKPPPTKKNDNMNICTLDIETCIDKNTGLPCPYSLSYTIDNKTNNFYGLDCVDRFISFIRSLIDNSKFTKTNSKKRVKKYRFYAHNGANFDYKYFHLKLKQQGLLSQPVTYGDSNKIIYMKCGNVDFCDSYSLLRGELRVLAKTYCKNTTSVKGYFPYRFSTTENLNYIGEIPDKSYWDKNDYDEYMKTNPSSIFNLKDITIEYNNQDSKLLYEIMTEFLSMCVGEKTIDNRTFKYDFRDKITIASMTLTFWLQSLKPSPPKNNDDKYKNANNKLEEKFKNMTEEEIENCSLDDIYNEILSIDDDITFPDIYYPQRPEVEQAANEAFYGGSVGFCKMYVKKSDNQSIWPTDRNSSYPATMTEPVPISYGIHHKNVIIHEATYFNKYYLYKVTVDFREAVKRDPFLVPNLPIRHNGKIYHPADQRDMKRWRQGVDLEESLLQGAIINVYEIIEATAKPIFKDYIKMLSDERIRLKGLRDQYPDTSLEYKSYNAQCEYYKLMMNSLYGKFSQRPYNIRVLVDEAEHKKLFKSNWNSNWKEYDIPELDGSGYKLVSYSNLESNAKNIGHFIHLSSYITAAARSNLFSMMRRVGFKNVILFDTDSVYFTHEGDPRNDPQLNPYLDNNELGKWKVESKLSLDYVIAFAPKAYCVKYNDNDDTPGLNKTKTKIKGIPKSVLDAFDNNFDLILNDPKNGYITFNIPIQWRKKFTNIEFKYNVKKRIKAQLDKRNFISLTESTPIVSLPKVTDKIKVIMIDSTPEDMKSIN